MAVINRKLSKKNNKKEWKSTAEIKDNRNFEEESGYWIHEQKWENEEMCAKDERLQKNRK